VAVSNLGLPSLALAVDDVSGSNVVTLPVPAGQKYRASSDGDTVVWDGKLGVWGYNNATHTLFQVPTINGWKASTPLISGDKIIFGVEDPQSYEQDIYGYDLSTDTTFVVCADPGSQGNYAFDGDNVVWVSPNESDSSHIYGKNISTGETYTVTSGKGMQYSPDVAGDWVVYTDSSGYHGDNIKAYNLVTKTTKTLCSWTGDQYYSRISSNGFVVWQNVTNPAYPNQTMDLYGCYVTDGAIRKVAGGTGAQHSPTIGGNIIVWMDDSKPGGYGLVGYDLLSGTRFGISKSIAWYYYIAGIQNGTIARLYTNYDVHPYSSKVQLFYPTALDIISKDDASAESIRVGDDGLVPDPASQLSVSSLRTASVDSTVVVASADSWAYSALACVLAGRQSPVLLTRSTNASAATLAKLAELAPAHVVIVGGTSSISSAVESQIASVVGTDTVSRVAGADCTARSIAIAKVLAARQGWNGTVLVGSTSSASSGLMSVPASVWKGLPLVLASSRGLSATQIAELTAAGAKRFVVVGTSVPASTATRLRTAVGTANVRVIAGTSVPSTSAKFAAWEVSALGMHWNNLAISSTSNWTHTPMAALSRGRAGSVLMMSDPLSLSSAVKSALVGHDSAIRHASFVGKSTIVSNAVRRQVRLAIK